MNMLSRLWQHLSKKRRRQFIYIQILIVVASFFEMASLGAVIPFLSVLSEPDLVFQQDYMKPFIDFFQFKNPDEGNSFCIFSFFSIFTNLPHTRKPVKAA